MVGKKRAMVDVSEVPRMHKEVVIQLLRAHPEAFHAYVPDPRISTVEEAIAALEAYEGDYLPNGVLIPEGAELAASMGIPDLEMMLSALREARNSLDQLQGAVAGVLAVTVGLQEARLLNMIRTDMTVAGSRLQASLERAQELWQLIATRKSTMPPPDEEPNG